MNHNRLFSHILVCVLVLFAGFSLALALPLLAESQRAVARSETEKPSSLSSSTCYATPDNGTTVFSDTNAAPVQPAVDAASPGNTVKVAGDCAGVQTSAGLTQTVYISKSLTLEGGHIQTNWSLDPDPDTYTTTLDASGEGRVIVVTGTNYVTLESFFLTGGKPSGGSLK